MQNMSDLFEMNARIMQDMFELNRNITVGWLEVASKTITGSSELAVAFFRDMEEATSPSAVLQASVVAGSKATKLVAERTGEAIDKGQKYVRDTQQVAARGASGERGSQQTGKDKRPTEH